MLTMLTNGFADTAAAHAIVAIASIASIHTPEGAFKTTEQQREEAMTYYYANRDVIAARYRNLAEEIKERRRERTRRWRATHKATKAAYDRLWRQEHAAQWRALQRKQRNKPEAKVVSNLRRRLREFVEITSTRTSGCFGCTPRQLRAHLEMQFSRGMTWRNYGQWHIDHIVPCRAFDLTDYFQLRLCFNWQNLRPVWAAENIAKGGKVVNPQLSLPIDISRT